MGPGPILLIWEEVPEVTKMFWLEGLSQDAFEKVLAAHGTYVNADDETEATQFVQEYLFDKENGKPKFIPIDDSSESDKPIELERACTVVICGFMM